MSHGLSSLGCHTHVDMTQYGCPCEICGGLIAVYFNAADNDFGIGGSWWRWMFWGFKSSEEEEQVANKNILKKLGIWSSRTSVLGGCFHGF